MTSTEKSKEHELSRLTTHREKLNTVCKKLKDLLEQVDKKNVTESIHQLETFVEVVAQGCETFNDVMENTPEGTHTSSFQHFNPELISYEPIYFAAQLNCLELLKIFVAAWETFSEKPAQKDIAENKTNYDNSLYVAALNTAIFHQHHNIVKFLLQIRPTITASKLHELTHEMMEKTNNSVINIWEFPTISSSEPRNIRVEGLLLTALDKDDREMVNILLQHDKSFIDMQYRFHDPAPRPPATISIRKAIEIGALKCSTAMIDTLQQHFPEYSPEKNNGLIM